MSNHTPMKVYVAPNPKGLSQAMYRIGRALERHIPSSIEITNNPDHAELQVLHVIGPDCEKHLLRDDIPFAMIQYCRTGMVSSMGANVDLEDQGAYRNIWDRAVMVWSYYAMGQEVAPTPFYFAPLGVDECFLPCDRMFCSEPSAGILFICQDRAGHKGDCGRLSKTTNALRGHCKGKESWDRDIGVITSGYVDGYGAEAISAVAQAAYIAGISCVHLGPKQEQFGDLPGDWSNVNGISDEELATLYSRSLWVSGLRYLEGFELPIIEGLACGARPIAFDRPDMHMWYDGLAEFVRETKDHDELVRNLSSLFRKGPRSVNVDEYSTLLKDFSWKTIAKGFWARLIKSCVSKGLKAEEEVRPVKGSWEDFGEGTLVNLHGVKVMS